MLFFEYNAQVFVLEGAILGNTIKKWSVYLTASILISVLGLLWFINYSAETGCLGSSGRWLSPIYGCDNGFQYSTVYLESPLAISIYLGIVLGVTSALVQIHSILFKSFYAKK